MNPKETGQLALLKELLGHGVELLLIRGKMARMDLLNLKDALLKILLCALAVMVVFFLGFICLLFALNAVLSPTAKIWVFFGLAVLAALVIVSLVAMILGALHSQQNCLKDTLDGLQDDLAYLQGKKTYQDISIKELDDDA